jgi:hypothetical protein
MFKKYVSIILLMSVFLRADNCPQLAVYCSDECLSEQELEAVKACSKTYNNLVVTNALRTSSLNVTGDSIVGGNSITSGNSIVNGSLNTGSLMVAGQPVVSGLRAYGSFANFDPVTSGSNVLWTESGSSLANPNNVGFSLDTSTGVITIANPGVYFYNFGVSLLGSISNSNQMATAQLLQNGTPVANTINNFTSYSSTNTTVNSTFPTLPFELSSGGIIKTNAANENIALEMTLTSSFNMPEANVNGANAYLNIFLVN